MSDYKLMTSNKLETKSGSHNVCVAFMTTQQRLFFPFHFMLTYDS